MTELEIKIKEAANAYYKDGSSPYTDEEFDEMMEELRETQPNSELLKNGVQEELKGVKNINLNIQWELLLNVWMKIHLEKCGILIVREEM